MCIDVPCRRLGGTPGSTLDAIDGSPRRRPEPAHIRRTQDARSCTATHSGTGLQRAQLRRRIFRLWGIEPSDLFSTTVSVPAACFADSG